MKIGKRISGYYIFLLLTLVLTACNGKQEIVQGQVEATRTMAITQAVPTNQEAPTSPTATPVPDQQVATPIVMTPSNIQKEVKNPQPTATLGADDWQDFPVIPTIVSERAKEIYRTGLAMGTNPDRFSKIGDCQNINTYFLALYDQPDQYTLGEEYQYLMPAIEHYSGSWSRESIAVKGGFNVASVFNPWFNNKELCEQNESPVDCELRLNKPSIVLISMETWWNGDASKYEGYLRNIVDTVIAYGAVPVLATKADNLEGNQTINRSIVKVAYEYEIPLWNYWAAVQPIPHHGLEDDGFHITHGLNDFSQSANLKRAWPLRNLTALQTLDFVWQELQ